jgi:hypothetical protein
VVGSSEPDHLEREGFLSEIGGSPEADRQIELSKGLDAFPGDDPVKRRRAGPDRGQIDLQEPEGLGVDDVEAAASVHEDLGKCWGLVLKCYELRTRQHKVLNVNVLRP